jgi:tetratricopeptide (TPR) repeat protein
LAIDLLEKCIKNQPQNAAFYHHLGLSYFKYGNSAKAKEILKIAIQLDPSIALIPEVKRILS